MVIQDTRFLTYVTTFVILGFKHNFEEKKVEVNMENLQVSFDLKNRNDFNLFSELVFMKWQCEEVLLYC